jgi:tRNA A37 threonylcarbamoyladenosine dehydratase
MKFERLELLVGNENLNLIQDKTVMIVGLGGVGGYATESIVRCGIKKIVIVDFDTIDESNINRQIIATIDSVDKYKVDAWEERIKKINPDCEVIKVKEYIDEDNIDHLFDYNLDYIVDACDSLKTKMDLIRKSIKYNVKLMSHNDSDKDKKNPSHDIRTIRLFPKAIYRSTVIKQKILRLIG